MQEQLFPKPKLSFMREFDYASRYEQVKAVHEADLSTVENCLGKCSVNLATSVSSSEESACLKRCYIKYLDLSLLVEKEWTLYMQPQTLAWREDH